MLEHVLSVDESIRAFRFDPDQWLWCLHCERFFQGRDARTDALGGHQACAYDDCDGAGYPVDIFDWDAWPSGNQSIARGWPAEHELRKGLTARAWAETAGDASDDWIDLFARDSEPALNDDWARRDEILGVYSSPDDLTWFHDLDVTQLEVLVAEGFMPLDVGIDFYPPARTFLEFMRRWPRARVEGFCMPGDAGDHRITLDRIDCDLNRVPLVDRKALTDDFSQTFWEATDFVCLADRLSASWC